MSKAITMLIPSRVDVLACAPARGRASATIADASARLRSSNEMRASPRPARGPARQHRDAREDDRRRRARARQHPPDREAAAAAAATRATRTGGARARSCGLLPCRSAGAAVARCSLAHDRLAPRSPSSRARSVASGAAANLTRSDLVEQAAQRSSGTSATPRTAGAARRWCARATPRLVSRGEIASQTSAISATCRPAHPRRAAERSMRSNSPRRANGSTVAAAARRRRRRHHQMPSPMSSAASGGERPPPPWERRARRSAARAGFGTRSARVGREHAPHEQRRAARARTRRRRRPTAR